MRGFWSRVGLALAATVALAFPGAVLAQAIQQSGAIVQYHPPAWFSNGWQVDGGMAGQPALSAVGMFNGANCPLSISSQPGPGATASPYAQFSICETASTATISLTGVNGEPNPALYFNVGGVNYPFPGPGGGTVLGPPSSVSGDLACFNGTSGTILSDCGASLPLAVSHGGTGASTASLTSFDNITGFTTAGTTGATSSNLVFSGSPTLTTPNLGTPSAITLTNGTGLPISGVTGLGTGVGAALAVNVGTAGAFVVNGGALGTPSSGVANNLTVTATGASTARTLPAYLADTANVLNFGADATGVANSTTGFQAAFSAKGNVFVPCGTYKLNATWASPIGALLSGGGVGCTTLEPFSTGSDVLKITSGNFTTIKDLAVLTTSGNGNGIELDGNTGNTTLDNLSVGGSSPSNGFTNGVLSDGGPSNSGLYILGGWYLNNAGSGLNLAGTSGAAGANDYHIVGAQFGANATAGISATFANAGQITDDFLWSNGVGFKGANDDYIWLDRDRITQSGAQGVLCATCLHVNLQHGQYYQNSSTTVGAAPDVAFTTSSFVLAEGNDFFDWTNSPHTNYAITNDAGSSIFDIEQNDFATTAVSAFTGSVSGTTLTWNTVLSTAPANGQTLYGASVPTATTLSGCSGSTSGTCTTSHSGSISSEAMAAGASANVAHTLGATNIAGAFGEILRNNIPLTEATAYSPFWSGNITLLGQLSATNQTSSGYALVGLTSGASAVDEGGLALDNPSTANNAAVQEVMECGVSLCGGIIAQEQGATQGGNLRLESANTSGVLVTGMSLDDAQNATFAAGVTLAGLTGSSQCLQVTTAGLIGGTGSPCGSSGGAPGGANSNVQYNNSSAFGGNSGFVYDGTSKITLGVAGASVGGVALQNATSGSITLNPPTGALGTVTATLPANTGTIAETNLAQTFSAAQSFNDGDLKLNGSSSGAMTLKAPAAASTFVMTFPSATDTVMALGTQQTVTAAKTFNNSDIVLLGSSTGATTFASANAGASNFTLTFPAATDTVAAIAATQTLTNKSIAGTEINSSVVGNTFGGTGANLSGTGGANQVVQQTTSGGAFTVGQLAASALSNGTTGSGSVVLATSPTVTGISSNTYISTVATGTPPLTVTSTTNVANLNASSLNGATFAVPGAIGSTTPSTGAFTTETIANPTGGTGALLISTHGASAGDLNALGLANPSVASFTTVDETLSGGVGVLAQLEVQENGTGSGGSMFLNTSNTSGALVAGLAVDYNQHVALGGPAPSVSSCGTGSPAVSGTDSAGTLTIGTSATACTLSFNHAYVAAPHCVLSDRTLISNLTSYAVGTSSLVLTMTSNSGNQVDYVCSGS